MAGNGPSRRAHVRGGRPHVFSVSLSTAEQADVAAAAAAVGMAPGAWLADTGVRIARGQLRPSGRGLDGRDGLELGRLEAVLRACVEQLRRAGTNLNQLTARANTTGVVGVEAPPVLARVGRAVTEADAALVELGRWVRQIGPSVTGEGGRR